MYVHMPHAHLSAPVVAIVAIAVDVCLIRVAKRDSRQSDLDHDAHMARQASHDSERDLDALLAFHVPAYEHLSD